MFKKPMSGLLAAAVAVGLTLAAPKADAAEMLVDQIRDRGELKVLVTSNYPYSYKEPGKDEWTGYLIELAHDIAGVLDVKLVLRESNWATLIPSLTTGKADAIFAPMFLNSIRGSIMYLTDPVAYSGHHIVLRSDDGRFSSYEDFNDSSVTFAVFPNASETQVKAYFPEAVIKIITSDNPNAPRMEVLAGRADASVTDRENAYKFVEANPQAKVFPGPPFIAQPIIWGVRPENGHFAQFINVFLQDRRISGTIASLGRKYNLQVEPAE